MSWTISSLISGGLIVTGSTALFLAVWMIARLRKYRSANGLVVREESAEGMVLLSTGPQFLDGLLSESDFEFLAAQPGYRPAIGNKLRRHRKRIFRLYLCELAGEFHRIHAEAREAVANSGEEHAPLVGMLFRQEMMFWRSIVRIELSLAMPRFLVRRFANLRSRALAGLMQAMNEVRPDLRAPASVL